MIFLYLMILLFIIFYTFSLACYVENGSQYLSFLNSHCAHETIDSNKMIYLSKYHD